MIFIWFYNYNVKLFYNVPHAPWSLVHSAQNSHIQSMLILIEPWHCLGCQVLRGFRDYLFKSSRWGFIAFQPISIHFNPFHSPKHFIRSSRPWEDSGSPPCVTASARVGICCLGVMTHQETAYIGESILMCAAVHPLFIAGIYSYPAHLPLLNQLETSWTFDFWDHNCCKSDVNTAPQIIQTVSQCFIEIGKYSLAQLPWICIQYSWVRRFVYSMVITIVQESNRIH